MPVDRSVNPEKVIGLFRNVLSGNYKALTAAQRQFLPYIASRKVMQWGALADQFDMWEKQFGVTLQLLKFFDMIDYPLSFSTKSAWWTEDPRYMALFARHKHNWHVKISIITADKMKARILEGGVPTPMERIQALGRLARLGVNTTLRLRPFVIGASDDWPILVDAAAKAGVKSVTTEFFCMEARADERAKERYREMSRVVGYDIWDYYMKNSRQHGYKRLSKEIKLPIIRAMAERAHSHGMRFNVSDAHCREFNDFTNCCGVPPEWNSQTSHFGNAILIAKRNGTVRFKDIRAETQRLFQFPWQRAEGFNTGNSRNRAVYYDTLMHEWIRDCWNGDSGNSPGRMYSCLKPAGVDDEGNREYHGERNV